MKILFKKIFPQNAVILFTAIFSILLFAFILVNRNPFLIRQASILLRYGFTITIPLVFLILVLGHRPSGLVGVCTSMVAILVLFGMDLNGLWASGQSESVVVSGLLPWSDAKLYYLDAVAWLEGFTFSDKSSMRPLFTSFLSLVLSITGQNLQFSIALLVLIVGFSSFFFGQKVKESHGYLVAAFALLIVYFYYRRLGGTTLTENIGLALSLLGFAFLWIGIREKGKPGILFGIFLIALSLSSRPGPFFILPLLIFWSGWLFRDTTGDSRRGFISMLVLSCLVVILAFGINSAIQKVTSDQDILPFANFSYALYGLASGGKGYTQIFADYPQVKQLFGNDRYLTIYRLTFDLIKQNPFGLVVGAFKSLKDFLLPTTWYGIFGYMDGDPSLLSTISRSLLEILSGICLFFCIKQKNDPYQKLILFVMIGTLLSVPFVPPGDAHKLRLYSSVIPVIGLLPALGFDKLLKLIPLPKIFYSTAQYEFPNQAIAVFSIILVVMLAGSPLMSKWFTKPTSITPIQCSDGLDPIYFNYQPGSYVTILRDRESFLDWLPNFHASQFRDNIHGLPDKQQMSNFLDIKAPNTLLSTIDIKTGNFYWVLINPDLLPEQTGTLLGVCGKKDNYLFNVYDVMFPAR